MKLFKLFFAFVFFFMSNIMIHAQNVNLSGRIIDNSGEYVIGATIQVPELELTTLSDKFGYFNLTIPRDRLITLNIMHVSYKTKTLHLKITHDTVVFIILFPNVQKVGAVEIFADRSFISNDNLSQINVPLSQINLMPVVLGAKDVFKSLQIMPGIQPGAEGTSQLNVRGGSSQQNIVLIDDMPVYYNTHIYGFLSTLNTESIKSMKLYKGGIPAKYNNFTSAVVDVAMKDGDLYFRNSDFNVDLMSVAASYNGYVKKGKLSSTFFVRRSLWDLFLLGYYKIQAGDGFINYNFYDINNKYRYKLNNKNTLFLSLFTSRDLYVYSLPNQYYDPRYNINIYQKEKQKLDFSNNAMSIRWFSMLNNKLTSNTIFVLSKYNYNFEREELSTYNSFNSDSIYYNYKFLNTYSLPQITFKINFKYHLSNSFDITTGFNAYNFYHSYDKSSWFLLNYPDYRTQDYDNKIHSTSNANSINPYLQFNFSTKFISGFLGVNYNLIYFGKQMYYSPDPRINILFSLSKLTKFQISYSRSHQFYHLIGTSALSSPSNIYMPSTVSIPPETGNIYDLTFEFHNKRNFMISLSSYYKTFDNLLRYSPGVSFLRMEGDWTQYIITGSGYSYGFEFLLSKAYGRLKMLISYTYSRSFRQFERINGGEIFPYKYDRPHIFNFSGTYKINEEYTISTLWTFFSGNLLTLPSHYYLAGFANMYITWQNVEYFSGINNVRAPVYNRLDVALNYHKFGKHSYWSFGIYNVYNRLNPVYMEPSKPGYLKGVCLFPIMPFFSYRYEFSW